MAEIVNIVGGGVKSRLVELDNTLKLGLPVLVEGRLRSFARQQTISVPIEMGELPAWIVILLSLEE
jgi:CheY-specific phosphatase CheX